MPRKGLKKTLDEAQAQAQAEGWLLFMFISLPILPIFFFLYFVLCFFLIFFRT